MQKLLKSLLSLITTFSLSLNILSCTTPSQTSEVNNNEIHYSINVGTKIDTLSNEKQALLDDYIEDCKIIFTNNYNELAKKAPVFEIGVIPYLAFTDTFVYDFTTVDLSFSDSSDMLKMLQSLREDKMLPIMYVELQGYCTFLPTYNSFLQLDPNWCCLFIFEDRTFVNTSYITLSNRYVIFEMPKDTLIINCGDKYAEELNANSLSNYNKKLKTLKLYE